MSTDNPARAGDSFVCPRCGKESIAKLEKVMDGWTCVGESLVCAFCKEPVAEQDDSSSCQTVEDSDTDGLKRLADFLDEPPADRQRLVKDAESRFCRDCVNFLRHPFVSRCLLHDKPVEPMDDCADFEPRPDALDAEDEPTDET